MLSNYPIRTYKVAWVDGSFETVSATSVVYDEVAASNSPSGHIRFWLNGVMVLSVLGSEVGAVRLVN